MPKSHSCPTCPHCDCVDWSNNINHFVTAFNFMVTHGLKGYQGKKFDYCPWCAKKLIVESIKN